MSVSARKIDSREDGLPERLERLERASARRRKLEGLFDDPAYIDRTLRDGRYLRLCAAIAWASAREERAREAVETDLLVDRLRTVMSGRRVD